MEAAFERGFPTIWNRIGHTIDGPTQVDETQQICSGFEGQDPPREGLSRGGSPEGGRTRWSGEQSDELTLVAACRDVLCVVSAEEGSKYDKNLGPVIEEADDLSQPWEWSGPTNHQPIREWNTIIGQFFTTRNTSQQTEFTRTRRSVSGRCYSHGSRSSAICPSGAWSRPLALSGFSGR